MIASKRRFWNWSVHDQLNPVANQALAGTVVVAITFTFLTGVKLVISEGLPAWDHSDEESIRKKNLLTYAFLIAPAVAPIVYLWGVL